VLAVGGFDQHERHMHACANFAVADQKSTAHLFAVAGHRSAPAPRSAECAELREV
jgi:hypothetical protein